METNLYPTRKPQVGDKVIVRTVFENGWPGEIVGTIPTVYQTNSYKISLPTDRDRIIVCSIYGFDVIEKVAEGEQLSLF